MTKISELVEGDEIGYNRQFKRKLTIETVYFVRMHPEDDRFFVFRFNKDSNRIGDGYLYRIATINGKPVTEEGE